MSSAADAGFSELVQAAPADHGMALLSQIADPGSVCRTGGLAERMAAFPAYRAGLAWLREVIMQPDPALLRPGAVCPFVAQSMASDALIFAVRTGMRGGAQAAYDYGMALADVFALLEPVHAPASGMKALTVFFPDLPEAEWEDFIDGGHALLKPELVARGVMLGEFQPNSAKPGASNPEYRAMRAPVPAFVYREMAMHDTKFITMPGEAASRRVAYLRAYLKFQGHLVPPKVRRGAERMLEEALAEIAARH